VLDELGNAEKVRIGGLVQLAVRMKPATKARKGRNPATGEEITISAKPASFDLRARPLAKAASRNLSPERASREQTRRRSLLVLSERLLNIGRDDRPLTDAGVVLVPGPHRIADLRARPTPPVARPLAAPAVVLAARGSGCRSWRTA
jgi:Bacterial DNA-binding protein